MKNNYLKIFISPLFLLGLFILLLNDFVLKAQFHNFLTGKLSDFAGLFVFALFWTVFFPKWKPLIFSFIVVFFAFWKSPFSGGFIDWWNTSGLFTIGRTIDYTDLVAFSILPPAWIYSEKYAPLRLPRLSQNAVLTVIAFVSVFAFTATSYEDDRNVWFNKSYTFAGSKEKLVAELKNLSAISELQFRNETEVLGNSMPKNKIDADNFWLEFKINQKVCESNKLSVTIYVKGNNESTSLDFGKMRFWCKEKPTEETEKQILQIFENEVAEKVKLIPRQTKQKNESGN